MASHRFQQDTTETGANSKDEIIQLAANNLAIIFGENNIFDNLEVGTSQVWSADSFSVSPAFAYFAPIQKTRLFKTMITPEWFNHAHFAVEHVSYYHGWIEGEFESAHRSSTKFTVNNNKSFEKCNITTANSRHTHCC